MASPVVFEILGSKHIGVTILILQGPVTSSITWPCDSSYTISYNVVVLWNGASISNGFRDIQWRMWRNGWHDLNI